MPCPSPPRLCYLKRPSIECSYGFSLHATKGEIGQYIADVDPSLPAGLIGLKDDDMVIEVNGKNILSLSHLEVVTCILSNPCEVQLLVVDAVAREYYNNRSVDITSALPEVLESIDWSNTPSEDGKLKDDISGVDPAPDYPPISDSTNDKQSNSNSGLYDHSLRSDLPPTINGDPGNVDKGILIPENDSSLNKTPSPPPLEQRNKPTSSSDIFEATYSQINTNLSAEEMRSRLSNATRRRLAQSSTHSFAHRAALFEQL